MRVAKVSERESQLRAKVRDIIEANLGVDEKDIVPSASLIDDLGADSLDIVEMGIGFEEAFSIEIPDDDFDEMRTVEDVVQYLFKRTR